MHKAAVPPQAVAQISVHLTADTEQGSEDCFQAAVPPSLPALVSPAASLWCRKGFLATWSGFISCPLLYFCNVSDLQWF